MKKINRLFFSLSMNGIYREREYGKREEGKDEMGYLYIRERNHLIQ